jgi:hypothetical protein
MQNVYEKHDKVIRDANCITNELLANTWLETEYRLDVCRANNGAHIQRYCAHKFCRFPVYENERTYLLSYSFAPWCKIFFEKLTDTQLVKEQIFFTEPEGSLPCLQKPASGPYPEPAESSSPIYPYLPKVHLNVILPPMTRPSQWSLTFGPQPQNLLNTLSLIFVLFLAPYAYNSVLSSALFVHSIHMFFPCFPMCGSPFS